MKKILTFEYLKFIKTKKNWILSIFLILFTMLNVYSSNQLANDTMLDLKNKLNEQIGILESEKSRAKADFESDDIDSETKKSIEAYLTNTEETIEKYNRQLSALNNNDFQDYWTIEIDNLSSIANNSRIEESELFEIQKQYLKLDYIKSNNISFEKNEIMPNKSWAFMSDFLSLQSSFIIIIVLILIIGDIVSKDFESNYRFLYTTLFKKKNNVIISKLIITIFSFTLFFVLQSAFVFLVQGFLNGFGSPEYPIVLGNNLESLKTVSAISFYFRYFVYYIVLLSFLTSAACLLGMMIKRNTLVIGSMAVTYLAFYYMKDNPIIQNISKYNPITYLNVYSVCQYSDTILNSNSYLVGIFYLATLSIIFILLSFRLSYKYY